MTTRPRSALLNPIAAIKTGGQNIREQLYQFRETDPSYADCFGDQAYTTQHKACGRIVLWRTTGHLAVTASKIEKTLANLINEKEESWQRRRPKADTNQFHKPAYLLESFLIGASKARASPKVTIICAVQWFSSCLKDIIVESNILSAYLGWGCFRLPFEPYTAASNLIQMETGSSPDDTKIIEYGVYVLGDRVPTYLSGTQVEIWIGGTYLGSATVGGILSVGDKSFALTVAHSFYPHQSPAEDQFEIDPFELDLLEGVEISQEYSIWLNEEPGLDAEIPSLTRAPSLTNSSSSTLGSSTESSDCPRSEKEGKTLIGRLKFISKIQHDGACEQTGLDWALIRIVDSRISMKNQPRPILSAKSSESFDCEKSVTIITPYAPIKALLVSDAIFGIPVCSKPQPVTVANVGDVERGESGSWVVQSKGQEPVGMLLGACPPLGESYILRMNDILQDISFQTGLPASIALSDHPNPQRQLSFLTFVDGNKRCGVDGYGNEVHYISLKKLESYWLESRLSACLGLRNHYRQSSIVHDVMTRYLRLYSILVYINEHEHLQWFVDEGFDDRKLPIIKRPSNFPGSQSCWEMFQENQWMFSPLNLDTKDMFRKHVHSRTILPFANQRPLTEQGTGSNNPILVRVKLDAECNELIPNNMAILKIYSSMVPEQEYRDPTQSGNELVHPNSREDNQTEDAWEAETTALEALSQRGGSDHIAKCFGSYRQGSKRVIILEDDAGETLAQFLQVLTAPKEPIRALDIWQGLFGLLKGLERLHHLPTHISTHRIHCWHSDIKPTNVLVFTSTRTGGLIFKIADLRTSHENSTPQRCLTTYQGQKASQRSSNVDIWSLGCVMSTALCRLSGTEVRYSYPCDASIETQTAVQQQSIWSCWRPNISEAQDQDRVSNIVGKFILNQMLIEEPGSAREIYRRFHDEVLPLAYLNGEELLERGEDTSELPNESIPWETRSQRSSTVPSTATADPSDVDSGFFSGTTSSSATKLSDNHNEFVSPDVGEPKEPTSSEDCNQSSMTVDDISRWITALPKIPLTERITITDPWDKVLTPGNFLSRARLPIRLKVQLEATHSKSPISNLFHHLSKLKGRDHIFLVDDSPSMRQHWHSVRKTFAAMEFLLNIVDESPIDLFFTSDPIIGYQSKKHEPLAGIVARQPPYRISMMKTSLETLADRIITKNLDPEDPIVPLPRVGRRHVSFYIFTDGVWEPSWKPQENAFIELERAFDRIVSTMKEQRMKRNCISIQFIRFGDSGPGAKRLDELDRIYLNWRRRVPYEPASTDIVDMTAHDASIVKMLLGSIEE